MEDSLHPIHQAERHVALLCNGYYMHSDLAKRLAISVEEKCAPLAIQSTSCYWYSKLTQNSTITFNLDAILVKDADIAMTREGERIGEVEDNGGSEEWKLHIYI